MSANTQFLAIDQGTQSTRAALFDRQGNELRFASQPVALSRLEDNLVEQDGQQIAQSLDVVIDQVLQGVRPTDVVKAGMATQRSSVMAWDRRTRQPISKVLSWLDTRCQDQLQTFQSQANRVQRKTGLPLSPHYGATKLRWLQTQCEASQYHTRIGPLASFLIDHLVAADSGKVDYVNASRTQLLGLESHTWDPELLAMFQVDPALLPEPVPNHHDFGKLAHGIPLQLVNGDQNAALFGIKAGAADEALVNLGTGAFVCLFTGPDIVRLPGLLTGIAQASAQGCEYLVEGPVNGAGAALAWAVDALGLTLKEAHHQLPRWLAEVEQPPLFLNTVGGLGAPWWRNGGPPRWVEERTSASKRARLAAVIESIVFLLAANIDVVQRYRPCQSLCITGGLSALDGLVQRLANLTGCTARRVASREATLQGIVRAMSPAAAHRPLACKEFVPVPCPALRERYERFLAALADEPAET